MTEIRKESWEKRETTSAALVSVAEKAKELLGYDVLAKVMEKKPIAVELTELQMVLKSLEIQPLNAADVLAYQKERLIEQTTANLKEWMKEIAEADALKWWRQFSGPAWRIAKIETYKQPIPEFVIAKAVEIKERLPECQIYIESLESHPDPFLIVGIGATEYDQDKPKEHYYIEVWDEPKFEGRVIDDSNDIPF